MKLLLGTLWGKILATFVLSMLPVIELRGGLPFGLAMGLDYRLVVLVAVLGNMVPVPFIIVYIRRILKWLCSHGPRLDAMITKIEKKAHLKGRLVHKYQTLGLCILVAIPLPGTGAWTGALVAAVLDMRLKQAVPAIFLGVCIAAAIVGFASMGVPYMLLWLTA